VLSGPLSSAVVCSSAWGRTHPSRLSTLDHDGRGGAPGPADEAPWHQQEAVTAAEALVASTAGGGVPGVGDPADLVLLDENPLAPSSDTAVAARRLRSMRVAATFVAGEPTHLDL
jgi:hypothetical protein